MPSRTSPEAKDFQVPQVTTVKLDDVEVPEFQRGRSDKWAQDIAENWNPLLFRPPLLARRKDGRLDIIDGQHTIEAVKLRGHDEVPAFVREGMELKDEASVFADLNTRRKGLRPFEVWRSETIAGRPWAVTLDQLARKYGLKVAHEKGPLSLACIGQCRVILRKERGAEYLDQALYVLTNAWDDTRDPDNDTRVDRGLVAGMTDLIERASAKTPIDKDAWVDRLRQATFKVGQRGETVTARVTPRSFPSYVASLIEQGKITLTSIQTGSGQSIIQGKALAILVLGLPKARQLYP